MCRIAVPPIPNSEAEVVDAAIVERSARCLLARVRLGCVMSLLSVPRSLTPYGRVHKKCRRKAV